jgi:hypothetical protein
VKDRTLAWIMTAAVAVYMVFAVWRAFLLMAAGDIVNIALGLAIIVIPAIGAWLIYREVRFGMWMQRMGRALEVQGGLPLDDLEKAPSGRPDRAAADARFEIRKAEVEASPQEWACWYRLALAYDDARDRKRARAAMRQALALYTPTL